MTARPLTRRQVLVGAVATAAGWAVRPVRLPAAESVLQRRRPTGLKLSCSCLAFSEKTWEEALVELRNLGFRYADLSMFEGWCHVSPSQLTGLNATAERSTKRASVWGSNPSPSTPASSRPVCSNFPD